jgi:hypothetical protein
LTLLKNQCTIAYISGKNDQDITVLSTNMNANPDYDTYSPNDNESLDSRLGSAKTAMS